jgi:hypothetical protein
MASNIQAGLAVATGINSTGGNLGISGVATFLLETAKLSHKFDLDRIKDEANFTRSLVATDGRSELALLWTPAGATRAAAAATIIRFGPLVSFTLSGFEVDIFNGLWVYTGDLTVDLSHKEAKYSLKVEQWDDPTQNTSLNTIVIG